LEGLAYLEDVDDDEPEDRGPAGKEVVGLGHQVCSLQRIATFNPESSAVIIKYVPGLCDKPLFPDEAWTTYDNRP
jgi:hypothetical protein